MFLAPVIALTLINAFCILTRQQKKKTARHSGTWPSPQMHPTRQARRTQSGSNHEGLDTGDGQTWIVLPPMRRLGSRRLKVRWSRLLPGEHSVGHSRPLYETSTAERYVCQESFWINLAVKVILMTLLPHIIYIYCLLMDLPLDPAGSICSFRTQSPCQRVKVYQNADDLVLLTSPANVWHILWCCKAQCSHIICDKYCSVINIDRVVNVKSFTLSVMMYSLTQSGGALLITYPLPCGCCG